MVFMLDGRQPFREIACVMVEHVTQGSDAEGRLVPGETLRAQHVTEDVPDRFRAVLVALALDQVVEGAGEVLAE